MIRQLHCLAAFETVTASAPWAGYQSCSQLGCRSPVEGGGEGRIWVPKTSLENALQITCYPTSFSFLRDPSPGNSPISWKLSLQYLNFWEKRRCRRQQKVSLPPSLMPKDLFQESVVKSSLGFSKRDKSQRQELERQKETRL